MRKLAAITALVVGILMSVSAVVTWVVIYDRLSDQKIVVAEDADCLAGHEVKGPPFAFCQAAPAASPARALSRVRSLPARPSVRPPAPCLEPDNRALCGPKGGSRRAESCAERSNYAAWPLATLCEHPEAHGERQHRRRRELAAGTVSAATCKEALIRVVHTDAGPRGTAHGENPVA